MKIKCNHIFLLISFIGMNFGFKVPAQTSNETIDVYDWFDSINGDENAELYNGVVYVEEYKVTNDKHRFFKTGKYILGNVTYNGNTYYNQQLKYDLLNDELLVKPKTASDALLLQIVKNKIDSFTLSEHQFIKINPKNNINYESEFYEKLAENKGIILLKKHSVSNLGKANEHIYYEFRPKSKFFLFYKNLVYSANTKSEVISIFNEQKKTIRKVYKKNHFLKKTNPDKFMRYLVNQLEPII